jgi:hypothetical protein
MTVPYLKYYVKENPNYGKEKKEFIPPTVEEYVYLRGLEPNKIIRSYNEYVRRAKEEHYKEECEFQVDKAPISEDKDIEEIENSKGFIRWM